MATTTATKTANKGTKVKANKATTESNSMAKKEGLRKPQVRILQCLSKATKPLDRKAISAKAPVDLAFCTEYLGAHDDTIRKANDAKIFPSLRSLSYVKAEQHDVDGKDTVLYSITANGRKALEKALKE